ncbi:hypothetical protein HK096_006829 [Nowakowskiella sp. JEL0078]|nr:hypothetical protein HK096_006829 [Nowakowskiella sp. JEL0078]
MDLYLLLGSLKSATLQNPGLKIILMSAAVNEERLIRFFGNTNDLKMLDESPGILPTFLPNENHSSEFIQENYGFIRRIQAEGTRGFDVKVHFSESLKEEATSDLQKKDVNYQPHPHIVVFLPRILDITQACEKINKMVKEKNWTDLKAFPLYSALDEDLKNLVLRPQEKELHVRKIIFSTNVAETSLTIPDVGIVIDSGLQVEFSRDIRSGAVNRETKKISKTSAIQRKGRVGRTAPGECHFMYTEKEHESLLEYRTAKYDSLDMAILRMIAAGIDPFKFHWFEPPSSEEIQFTMELLQDLGFIELSDQKVSKVPVQEFYDASDDFDEYLEIDDEITSTSPRDNSINKQDQYYLTDMGKMAIKLVSLGLDARQIRFLIAGAQNKCFQQIITITAFMIFSQQQTFKRVLPDEEKEIRTERNDDDDDDDVELQNFLTNNDVNIVRTGSSASSFILWAYQNWLQNEKRVNWCADNGIRHTHMKAIHQLRKDVVKKVEKLSLEKFVQNLTDDTDEQDTLETSTITIDNFPSTKRNLKNPEFTGHTAFKTSGLTVQISKNISKSKAVEISKNNRENAQIKVKKAIEICFSMSFFTNVACNPTVKTIGSKSGKYEVLSAEMINHLCQNVEVDRFEEAIYEFKDHCEIPLRDWCYIYMDLTLFGRFYRMSAVERIPIEILRQFMPQRWRDALNMKIIVNN